MKGPWPVCIGRVIQRQPRGVYTLIGHLPWAVPAEPVEAPARIIVVTTQLVHFTLPDEAPRSD